MKPKSRLLKWVAGVVLAPVVVFVLMMIYHLITAGSPEEERASAAYRSCIRQWQASNGTNAALKEVCDSMRNQFAQRYGKEP